MVTSYHPLAFILAASMRCRVSDYDLQEAARWAGCEAWLTRPLPADRPAVVLTPAGVELRVPGMPAQPWHPGLTPRRLARPEADPLVRALALQPGETVVDATLGLGHDALVLAKAGARVVGLEATGPLLSFTLRGLWAYAPKLARRIHGCRAEHRAWLAEAPGGSVDHVYFDPLFPPGSRAPNGTWDPLGRVGLPGRAVAEAVAAALRVARRRVVLKLAPDEAPPEVDGRAPLEVASRRTRFAVWEC